MKKTLIPIICCLCSIFSFAQETGNALVDSITQVALQTFSTPEGIRNAQLLTAVARREGIEKRIYSGYKLRLSSYQNMGMNDEVIALVDSFIKNTDVFYTNHNFYINLMSSLSKAYTDALKFRLAVQIATQMYEESRDYINEEPVSNPDGSYTIPDNLFERISALQCMAAAYNGMNHFQEGLDVEEEILKITDKWPIAFRPDRIDAAVGISTLMFNSDNGDLMLKAADRTEAIVEGIKESDKGTAFEDDNYLVYEGLTALCRTKGHYLNEDFSKGAYYYNRLKEIKEKCDNYILIGWFYEASAIHYDYIDNHSLAISYADSVLALNAQNGVKDNTSILLLKLHANHKAKLYSLDYKLAMELLNESDSIANAKFLSAADEMNTMLGMDKLRIEKQELEARQARLVLISILIIITGLFLAAIISLRSKHKKAQEKQRMLAEQKDLLEKEVARQTSELRIKNALIEKKNRDITDSINYAQQIQKSVITDLKQFIGNGIADTFAFYLPCNIVSGDFYWAKRNGDNIIFVCADCTGHGVPGAFMSMIGTTLLNEICGRTLLPSASQILEELDDSMIAAMNNNGSNLQDGMDIALVVYNTISHTATMSAARRPVCLFSNNKQTIFKGSKRSIGDRDEDIRKTSFEEQQVSINPGDIIYLYSDGFCDQFGGQNEFGQAGRRLKSSGLYTMIDKVAKIDFELQGDMFEKLYSEWRGTCEQLDDITLIGIKF